MTYNVFGGTLSLTQSINQREEIEPASVLRCCLIKHRDRESPACCNVINGVYERSRLCCVPARPH